MKNEKLQKQTDAFIFVLDVYLCDNNGILLMFM